MSSPAHRAVVCPDDEDPRLLFLSIEVGPDPRSIGRRVAGERIVTALRPWAPERVILFGSHARGAARPDSDLDILVVLPDADAVTRRPLIDMRLAIGAVPLDYDLLITSGADFA